MEHGFPMVFAELSDDREIERFLRSDPTVHLYCLGDLDPFFRPHTRWFAAQDGAGQALRAVFMLFTASPMPVLLALEERDPEAADALLAWLGPRLPVPFYCHLSLSLMAAFAAQFVPHWQARHLRLTLGERSGLETAALPPGFRLGQLGTEDLPLLQRFYDEAYAGHWFEGYMLDQGVYVGVFGDGGLIPGGTLVSVAGTHIASASLNVAAVGNVATLPGYRGRGLAAAATAAVCRELGPLAAPIGLNVNAANSSAVSCYQRLGFTPTMAFEELMIYERQPGRPQ